MLAIVYVIRKLSESSDRLGGVNLAEMRDTMQKRTYSEFEEASYTKQKRLKAEKAAAEMKRKLEVESQTAADSGTNLVNTIMSLRADAERAEAARAEISWTRRREERRVEREAADAVGREKRRVEREAAKERRREDRREVR
ncbi:hypothetical protein JG688_00008594 [Phytophthora aleatoria]|uniref:Uncharacterized protein n=1 Tax=Phytophthora aleatoria TaxID=2496075 RepID=A0A8J5J4M5_9STRA|nr:hypothetical protein JG688_00008594 [Phytophthora aleatoria]